LLALLLLWSAAATGAVTARFDRSAVHEGDTVTLIIETDGLRGGQPDLSGLDADFDVLGTSTGSRIQIVNGRQTATRTWQVTLAPKRLGTIQVPAIRVGNERTSELMLTVTEAVPEPAPVPGDDVFLELDIGGSDEPIYVQQQVPVTVRLFSALPLRVGELSTPRPEGAVLERLGEDTQYSTTRNGRRYQVVERRFSLSPERSGELRVPPVVFKGELRTADSGPFGDDRLAQLFRDPVFERFGSGLFERGEPVRARSRAVTLEVQPQPENFSGRWWLPAQNLAIDDSWERDPPKLVRGEPATRTLTITATGLAGSQIPQIEMPAPDAARVYADNLDAETRTDGERLFGVSRQQVTVMPTAGGTMRFPRVVVRWWDVAAGRERETVVPARSFEVTGPAGAADASPAQGAEAPDAAATAAPATVAELDPGTDAAAPAALPSRLAEPRRPIGWLLLAALGIGGVMLLWRLRRHLPRLPPPRPVHPSPAAVRRGAGPASALRTACAGSDARGAAVALLSLAGRAWGPEAPTSLGGIAEKLASDYPAAGARAAAAVRSLEASLYGPRPGAWDGAELAETVPPLLKTGGSAGASVDNDEPLAPLYPQRV
jgi:hypothetical protein